MPGAIYDPFDVVVVPFPFTDRPVVKRRPALVISARAFNDRHDQIVLAMITTAKGSDWPSDTPIEHWREAGLTTTCKVRVKLFTLEKALISRRLGCLDVEDRLSVGVALSRSFAVFA